MNFDHLTIQTRDLATTKDFFEKVFDVTEGERPAIIRKIRGHWLYDAKAQPVIHLIDARLDTGGNSAAAIDHVGLRPGGSYHDFCTRLEWLGIPYSLMDVVELHERRVFFHNPGGSLLEAVFDEPVRFQQKSRNQVS